MTTYLDQAWPKLCACCDRSFSEAQFRSLALRGFAGVIRSAGRVQAVELRDCVCTNTLGVEVELDMARAVSTEAA